MKDLIKDTFHSIVIYQNLLRQGVLSQWNIKTVRRAIEIFKIGINIGNFDEFISSEYINKESQLQSHNDSHRYPLKRPEEFLNTVKKFSTAFPDLYYKQRDHGRKYEDNTRIRILRANDPIGKSRKLNPFCRSLYF